MDREQESGVSQQSEHWNLMLCSGFVSLAENQMEKEKTISSFFVPSVPNICCKNRQQKGVEETTLTSFCYPHAFLILGPGICAARFKATQMVSAFIWLEPWRSAIYIYIYLMSSHFPPRKSFAPTGWTMVISVLKAPPPLLKLKAKYNTGNHSQISWYCLWVPWSWGRPPRWGMIHHSDSPVRTSLVKNSSDSKSWRSHQ